MSHSIKPFSLVLYTFFCVDVFSLAVSEAIFDLALVCRSIWPLVTSISSDFIASEFTSIDSSISPAELAFSVQKPVLEVTLVGVTVAELAGTLSMVDFADLKKNQRMNH